MNEEEILSLIEQKRKHLEEIILIRNNLNSQLLALETDYGESKLHLDSLKDQLRRLRLRTINYEPTERELEIERFRAALPTLLSKLTNNLES